METEPHPHTVRAIRRSLLDWFARRRRDLPWRRTRSPYRIWVAETMLQQTQSATVIPYYRRFLRRFPTLAALARAPLGDVLAVWAGLGYYGRARNLHAAAREVVERFGGRLPGDEAALRSLPGVGPYTAAAVASIAFGRDAAVVDGNVTRVLCRVLAQRRDPRQAAVRRWLWETAGRLLPPGQAGDFNQALMELGATLCTPRSPACTACPLRRLCRARRLGLQERLPTPARRRPVPHHSLAVGIIERGGKILLVQRPHQGLLGGMWEFPGGRIEAQAEPQAVLACAVREQTGLALVVGAPAATVRHAYSHLRVTLHAYHCRARGRLRLRGIPDARWLAPEDLGSVPLPAAARRIIEAVWPRMRPDERPQQPAALRAQLSTSRRASAP